MSIQQKIAHISAIFSVEKGKISSEIFGQETWVRSFCATFGGYSLHSIALAFRTA
jgi:hypothetical protein